MLNMEYRSQKIKTVPARFFESLLATLSIKFEFRMWSYEIDVFATCL